MKSGKRNNKPKGNKKKKRIKSNRNRLQKSVMGGFYGVAAILTAVVLLHHNPLADQVTEVMKKVMACLLIAFTSVIFGIFFFLLMVLPKELYQSRRLIWKLAKNDFKKRYAGSYLGMVWAFVQPVVTVVMYWIVFDRVFDTRSQLVAGGIEVPYVLYLTAGLVPWFYFNEALNNGTNALREYDYLVKKVVFKISILPIIKIIAATFVHVFFVAVLLAVAALYGYYPTLYTIQIVYYSFCLFIFVLALCYASCSVVVFFKDLTQIINIALQIGIWATPILWNIESAPAGWVFVLKLNPLVYVVEGYRSAIYGKQWFFQDFFSTMYFWIVTVVLFGLGAAVFRRLKVHFADVL